MRSLSVNKALIPSRALFFFSKFTGRKVFSKPSLFGERFIMFSNSPSQSSSSEVASQETTRKVKKLSKTKQKSLERKNAEKSKEQAVLRQFNAFYEEEFGVARWKNLAVALTQETRHCCMLNKFSFAGDTEKAIAKLQDCESLPYLSIPCFSGSGRHPPPERDIHNLSIYYLLDAASVLVTEALDVSPNDHVLDLCAAPGGKSLAILQRLSTNGQLTSNEMSQARRKRLRQV